MQQDSKIPLVITKNSFSIKLKGKTAEALLQQPRPILWCNDGLHCWFSRQRVRNMVGVAKDQQKHAEANDLPFDLMFDLKWHAMNVYLDASEMAQAIELMSNKDTNCPFCGETDFDLIGLKHHLNTYCSAYQETQDLS